MNRVRVLPGILLVLVVLSAALFLVASPGKAFAATGINQELSFEGKVVTAAGINVPDGTYNMQFQIYTGCTNNTGAGCTSVWSENWLVGSSPVTFSSGTFQVNLGSITAFGGSVPWNTNPLYLSLEIGNSSTPGGSCTTVANFATNCGGDGVMTPYILLTSTPYAFNSNELDGLTSSAFGQLATAQTWTAANTIQPTTDTTGLTVQQNSVASPSADIFDVNTANGTGVLQIDGPSANNADVTISAVGTSSDVTINPSGTGTLGLGTLASASTIQIGSTALAAGTQTINVGNNNTAGGTTNVTIGSDDNAAGGTTTVQGHTALNLDTTSGNINLVPGGANDVVFSEAAGSNMQLNASAPPTTDQLVISNAGQGVTTANTSGLQITYAGGAAAITGSGEEVDVTPGTTTGGTWNGLSVVAAATGAATGVTETGLNLTGPTTPGAGKEYGITIGSGWDSGLNMTSVAASPAAPAANTLNIYTIQQAGRTMLSSTDSNGNSFAYQPSLYQQSVLLCALASTTTIAGTGGACTISDNTTTAVTTTQQTGVAVDLKTAATADTAAGVWQTTSNYFVGNIANGSNGFFYFTRFYLPDANYGTGTTGSDFFFGMSDQTTAATMVSSANPAGNYAGIQYSTSRADAHWMCVSKNNTTQSTPASTGVTFTAANLYEVYVYAPSQGTTIFMQINDDTTGTTGTCSTTTDLPTSTTALRPDAFLGTLTGTARNIDFTRMYVETNQ